MNCHQLSIPVKMVDAVIFSAENVRKRERFKIFINVCATLAALVCSDNLKKTFTVVYLIV